MKHFREGPLGRKTWETKEGEFRRWEWQNNLAASSNMRVELLLPVTSLRMAFDHSHRNVIDPVSKIPEDWKERFQLDTGAPVTYFSGILADKYHLLCSNPSDQSLLTPTGQRISIPHGDLAIYICERWMVIRCAFYTTEHHEELARNQSPPEPCPPLALLGMADLLRTHLIAASASGVGFFRRSHQFDRLPGQVFDHR